MTGSVAPAVIGAQVRLPFADGMADGIISVKAAFHFRSRKALPPLVEVAPERWPPVSGPQSPDGMYLPANR